MVEKRKSGSARKAPSCPVEAYARAVASSKIVAGRLVRLACERHLADLKMGAKRGLVWDGAAARHAIDFFGHLRHSTGERQMYGRAKIDLLQARMIGAA